MTDKPEEPPDKPEEPPVKSEEPLGKSEDDGERPPLLAMLILVLFPFVLVIAFALLYGWIRR